MSLPELCRSVGVKYRPQVHKLALPLSRAYSTPQQEVKFFAFGEDGLSLSIHIGGRWMNTAHIPYCPEATDAAITEAWDNHTRITSILKEDAA